MACVRILLFTAFLFRAYPVRSQDSTAVVRIDSIRQTRIAFTHYYSQDQWSSVNFLRTFNDRDAFLPSNGIPVFNAIRAQLPGLSMFPSVYPAVAALRADIARPGDRLGYLIDGVPFNIQIGMVENFNMNGFEFASVSSASSANALALFDLPGGGALILKSRDGSGYTRSAFEFNTSYTAAWADKSVQNKEGIVLTSHSLAYMKDFGKVDTRVSYNLTTSTESSYRDSSAPLYHSIKVNTGMNFTERLSARLIMDDRFNAHNSELPYDFSESKAQNFFQSNLTARYRANDWLELSGQWVASRRDSVVTTTNSGNKVERNRYDDRDIWNLFANMHMEIGKHFVVSGIAGYQSTGISEDLKHVGYSTQYPFTNLRSLSIGSKSLVGGADVAFRKLANLSVQYRNTAYDRVRIGGQSRDAFSVGAGLTFSELLQWRAMPLGRLRVSYGESAPAQYASYPHPTFSVPGRGVHSGLWEFGADIGLLRSTFDLSVNYYYSTANSDVVIKSGYATITLFTENRERGWEAMLRYKTPSDGRFTNGTSLVFSSGWFPGFYEPSQYVRTGLFNESRWKSVSLGVLLEHNVFTGYLETNSLKVRELFVRFDSPARTSAKRISFAVSGRNLIDLFSGTDREKSLGPEKSISISLNLAL